MAIKLISLDLDGTLVESGLVISERNKKALLAAQEKGVLVTISTGRMFHSTKLIADQLNIDVPLITYNGAYIRTSDSGQVLLSQMISADLARDVVIRSQAAGFTPEVFVNDKLIVGHINKSVADYAIKAGVPVKAVGDLSGYVKNEVMKVLLIGDPEPLNDFWQECADFYKGRIQVVKSKARYLDFINLQAGKGQGLAFLAKKLQVKQDEILAIGDGYNDLSLFEAAGLKIAMGNAVVELKERADFITDDCQSDGLAVAVEKFVL